MTTTSKSPTHPLVLARRLARSLRNYGIRGAFTHAGQRLTRTLRNYGLGGTIARAFRKPPPTAQAPEPPHPFDLQHSTDTGGYITWDGIESNSGSNIYGNAYAGISPSTLAQAIPALPFPVEDFTFIDLGCGKGRALMVAAQFPFRHIIGVELGSDLCRIAEANIALNPDWAARISILNQDATTVVYPPTPLLLFLFDPFLPPILRPALANLERQLRQSPRPAYLLYARNPRYTEVMDRFPFLRELSDTAYALTPEETAADHFHPTQEQYTLYIADLTV